MKTILLLLLLACACPCIAQIQNLYFNSTSNIVRLDFSTAAPSPVYTGIGSGASIGEGIAHAEDKQGNIIIWVNASGVYDKNGTLMPSSTGILAHPSSSEIVICPFPGDPTKYYIFYNSQLCSSLYYAVVDMKLRSGLGEVISINNTVEAGSSFAEGLEIIRIPCSNAYWLLSYQCYSGFKRFKIDASGISAGTIIQAFNADNHNGRGELDYHNGKLGYAVTYKNRVFLADFDPLTGQVSNDKIINFAANNGIYGLEFSPDASKVYATDWNNRNFFGNISSPNLFRYDFTTNTSTSWTIAYNTSKCSNTTVEGLGQIEIGKDGKLYIPHVNGCQITVVDNPNEANPTFSVMDVNTILSTGVSDHIQSEFLQTIQITAEISNNGKSDLCFGESTLLTTVQQKGFSYQWYKNGQPLNGEISSQLLVKEEGNYAVKVQNNEQCAVTSQPLAIHVHEYPQVLLPSDTLVCGNIPLLLYAGDPVNGYSYRWQDNSAENTLTVSQSGEYTVQVSNGNCTSIGKIQVQFLQPELVEIPNVITPNSDQSNEFFVIKNGFGRIYLTIYNRWGKEVYRSKDYQNTWNASDLSNGAYFYQLSGDSPCFGSWKGIISVLR